MHTLICYFILFLSLSLHANNLLLYTTANEILRNSCSPYHLGPELIKLVKGVKSCSLSDREFHTVFQAFLAIKTAMQEHKEMLLSSYTQFKNTPGYCQTVWKMMLSSTQEEIIAGHSYEIAKALSLTQETIRGFNQIITVDDKQCEFDIVTDTLLIECKSIVWKNKSLSKVKRRLQVQKEVARLCKNASNEPYRFCLASKNDIPIKWKEWLVRNDIGILQ